MSGSNCTLSGGTSIELPKFKDFIKQEDHFSVIYYPTSDTKVVYTKTRMYFFFKKVIVIEILKKNQNYKLTVDLEKLLRAIDNSEMFFSLEDKEKRFLNFAFKNKSYLEIP